ncbi:ANTAR domain-containing protein [Streptacidiphilus sp. EB129]|uniref:Mu transposase domain-containing protein n=1 Tax=Streptacidiphilus sp. EB129 TaxID=3156262 RepID=UPI0035181C6D
MEKPFFDAIYRTSVLHFPPHWREFPVIREHAGIRAPREEVPMLTKQEYVDVHTLHLQGWSISAIARHLGRDRKTVRSYLCGHRVAGVRRHGPDDFHRFLPYCRERLADAAHLQATVLFDEIVELGYTGGYSTFTRALRKHRLRPPCTRCHGNPVEETVPLPRSASEEVRFAWLRLPDPPARWRFGSYAHLLVGMLTRTGRWCGALTDSEEFPQLAEAVDQVLRRLGGTGGVWRFDRSLAAYSPSTGKVARAVAQLAEHYGVAIGLPPAQDDRGVLPDTELRSLAHDWWSTMAPDIGIPTAQERLDQLTARMDARRTSVHALAREGTGRTAELLALPAAPFPAQICVMRTVSAEGLVSFRGNAYAVPADLAGAIVEVRWRLDETCLSIATTRGAVIARHTLAPLGAGQTVIGRSNAIVLERPTRMRPAKGSLCPGTSYQAPCPAALAEALALRGGDPTQSRIQQTLLQKEIIAQSAGVIAEWRGIDVDDAVALMRQHAHGQGVPLSDLARDVIEGVADVSRIASTALPSLSPRANGGITPSDRSCSTSTRPGART